MQCDWKCVDLDKAPASGRFGGLWRACVFFIDRNVTFAPKMVRVHNVHIWLNISFQTFFFFFFLCHENALAWKRKKIRIRKCHTHVVPVTYKNTVSFTVSETWACFDEHKKGILVNWEPPGSTAVGVTVWAGTDDKHTQSSLPTALSFFLFLISMWFSLEMLVGCA